MRLFFQDAPYHKDPNHNLPNAQSTYPFPPTLHQPSNIQHPSLEPLSHHRVPNHGRMYCDTPYQYSAAVSPPTDYAPPPPDHPPHAHTDYDTQYPVQTPSLQGHSPREVLHSPHCGHAHSSRYSSERFPCRPRGRDTCRVGLICGVYGHLAEVPRRLIR